MPSNDQAQDAFAQVWEFMQTLDEHPDYPDDLAQCSAAVLDEARREGVVGYTQGPIRTLGPRAQDMVVRGVEWLSYRYCNLGKIAPVPHNFWQVWVYVAIICDMPRLIASPEDRETLAIAREQSLRGLVESVTHGYFVTPDVPLVAIKINDRDGQLVWSDADNATTTFGIGPFAGPSITLIPMFTPDRESAHAALDLALDYLQRMMGRDVGRRGRGGKVDYQMHMEIYRAWRTWQQETGERTRSGFIKAVFDGEVRLDQWKDAPPTMNGIKTQLAKACAWLNTSDATPATFAAYLVENGSAAK